MAIGVWHIAKVQVRQVLLPGPITLQLLLVSINRAHQVLLALALCNLKTSFLLTGIHIVQAVHGQSMRRLQTNHGQVLIMGRTIGDIIATGLMGSDTLDMLIIGQTINVRPITQHRHYRLKHIRKWQCTRTKTVLIIRFNKKGKICSQKTYQQNLKKELP
jgi:predicted HAD superfamily phosphohydrolase YqeG